MSCPSQLRLKTITIPAVANSLSPPIPEDYEFRTATSGDLRIYAKDADTHRKIIRVLNSLRVHYTQFCLSEDRNFRVVARNLAASTPKGRRVVNL
ncbi:GL21883 [Drosophila persimilis]|uniref:GL21883 n=1 Tax=Drosophila persimilis TaxID=7234 RepID=B4GE63_DROPE|nr:GL21883 [Drosophila persimilis]